MERIKNVTYKGHAYTLQVPNMGQIIDMESQKALLTKGQYGGMIASRTTTSILALDAVDIQVTLGAVCPKFLEDMTAKNVIDLDVFDFKQLRDFYNKEVGPWVLEWSSLLSPKENGSDEADSSVES